MRRIILLTAFLAVLMLAACGQTEPTAEGPAVEEPAASAATVESAESVSEAAAGTGEFFCNPTGDEPTTYAAPPQVIREGHDYTATITMANGGEVVIDLYPEEAPITVNNFVFLACQGFYDGLTFHRVIPGFVAQGGDPTGTGTGGPGYTIEHEADNGVPFDQAGLLSMAHRMQPNTTGSQFFITYAPTPSLDADFTAFGEVVEGMDVVEGLTPRDPQRDPNAPPGDEIATIRVTEQ